MEQQAKTKKAAFGRPYYILVVVNALVSIAFYAVNPIITKYLTGVGTAITVASTIAGLFSLTALTVRPFTGIIADRIPQKQLMFIAVPLLALSVAGYATTTNVALFALFRILNGLAFCLNGTTLNAYAYKYVPKERMGEGIGYLGMGMTVATAIGPSIGSAVGEALGYRAAFLVAAGFAALGLVLLFFLPKEEPAPKRLDAPRKKLVLSDIIALQLIPIAFLNGLFSYSNGTVTNFLALLSDEHGIGNYSIYFTALAVFMFVVRPVAGKLTDRYGLKPMLIPAFFCSAAGLLVIVNARSLPMLLLATPLMAFGQGGGQPAIQAQCVKELDEQHRGVATSTYYIFADLFQGTGPIIGGFVADSFQSYSSPLYVSSGLLMVGLVLFLLLCAWRKKKGLPSY